MSSCEVNEIWCFMCRNTLPESCMTITHSCANNMVPDMSSDSESETERASEEGGIRPNDSSPPEGIDDRTWEKIIEEAEKEAEAAGEGRHDPEAYKYQVIPDISPIMVGAVFPSMLKFRFALADAVIKANYNFKVMDTKKNVFSARCINIKCPWRIRARMIDGLVHITNYDNSHVCGLMKQGRDHLLATSEWIASKCEGMYDDGERVTPKDIALHVKKYYFVLPSYRKCHAAKELLLQRVNGNQDASFQILPAYGRQLELVNPGIDEPVSISMS